MKKQLLSIEKHQQKFCLNETEKLGGVIWKCEKQLSIAIIVGEDETGSKYVVKNQPDKLVYRLVPLDRYVTSSCYIDTNNPVYDYKSIALMAFDMLYKHNDFNQNKYCADSKIILPQISSIQERPVFDSVELKRLFQVAVADPLQSSIAYLHNSMQQMLEYLRGVFGPSVQEVLPPVSDTPTPMINSGSSYRIVEFDSNRQIA